MTENTTDQLRHIWAREDLDINDHIDGYQPIGGSPKPLRAPQGGSATVPPTDILTREQLIEMMSQIEYHSERAEDHIDKVRRMLKRVGLHAQ